MAGKVQTNKAESEQNCMGKVVHLINRKAEEMGGEQRSSPSYGYREEEEMGGQQFVKYGPGSCFLQ